MNEKDYWIAMSIREIATQCHFAKLAYLNLDPKAIAGTDGVFSSIHSFLSYCAMVSKMLKAEDRVTPRGKIAKLIDKFLSFVGLRKKAISIGHILGIDNSSTIHNRKFRNHLEHYDERLKKWIRRYAAGAAIGTYNIGPKEAIKVPNLIFVSHYDPTDNTFTFVDEDFKLNQLLDEVKKIKRIADDWVQAMETGRIQTPFN